MADKSHTESLKDLHKQLVIGLTDAIKSGEAPAAFYKTAADLLRQEGVLAAMLDAEDRATIEDVLNEASEEEAQTLVREDGTVIDIATGKAVA